MFHIAGNYYSEHLKDIIQYAKGRKVKRMCGIWAVYG